MHFALANIPGTRNMHTFLTIDKEKKQFKQNHQASSMAHGLILRDQ
jgi:hypothetical protein